MMASLYVVDHLLFVAVTVSANQQSAHLPRVLLDTGSAATLFKTDDLAKLGVKLQPTDVIRQVFGVGGGEYVVQKQVEQIQVGTLTASPFTIQIGALDYGIPLDGILGLDFLMRVGAVVDFKRLELR